MKARFEFTSDDKYNEYLRTYFAAMAMQGITSNYGIRLFDDDNEYITAPIAEHAIALADALINELNKQL